VIVWLTDNVPNVPSEWMRKHNGKSLAESSLHTEMDAMQRLLETGTVVSCLLERSAMSNFMMVLSTRNPLFAMPRKRSKYADQTGGQVMKSGKEDVATKLVDLIDQIRTRYSLAYRPSDQPAGQFCQIKLKVSPDSIVKAKRGTTGGEQVHPGPPWSRNAVL